MIRSLLIQNIALIESLELNLKEGLNVLSGETGAGKSIMIDSLTFVLGDRADKGLIRYGEKQASVQVIFEKPSNSEFLALLEEYGIPEEEEIIIRRTLNISGRSDCRINGYAVNLNALRRIVTLLVDVHTQHESTYLLQESNHIKIFDRYVDNLKEVLLSYRQHYHAYLSSKAELEKFADSEERARRMDILEYQISEIDRVELKEGEEEELKSERAKLQNFQRVQSGLNSALTLINGEESFGVTNCLNQAIKELRTLERFISAYAAWSERMEGARIEINDVADEISAEIENGTFDPQHLGEIEKRLEEVRGLKRKFGNSLDEIEKYRQKAIEECDFLKKAGKRMEELHANKEKELALAIQSATVLHQKREKAKKVFESKIISNLKELGMGSASFCVLLDVPEMNEGGLNEYGFDKIQFAFSANKGEPLKPLAKIVSGGEMSRFMLGLKNITAEYEGIGTLVFDEIDTGISGKIAHVVACKLYEIAHSRQVIAVTHLPQLAAMADANFRITKSETERKTITTVQELNAEEKVDEIMRLSGSAENSVAGRDSATEMILRADEKKQEMSTLN